MSISQSQTVQDVLSTSLKGILSHHNNSKKVGSEAFDLALKTASNTANGWQHSTPSNQIQQGKPVPSSGKHLPDSSQEKAASELKSSNSSQVTDRSTDKSTLSNAVDAEGQVLSTEGLELEGDKALTVRARLSEAGIDVEALEKQVVESGLMSSAEFQALLESPDAFFEQLTQWLEDGSLFAQSLMVQFPQLADVIRKEQGASAEKVGPASYSEILAEESSELEGVSKLVGKLLDEKGQQSSDEGLSKDRFFAQLLMQKQADPSAKPSGFAFDLNSGLTEKSDKLFTASGVSVDAAASQGLRSVPGVTGELRALPQLPMLRGLPGQPGATEALNERIMMMRAKGLQMAEIRLDPPELGALTVKVKVTGDTTSIQFHSPHPEVREALESQVQRLREMMDHAGLALGDVGVSDQPQSERSEQAYASQGAKGVDSEDVNEGEQVGAVTTSQSIGLVDYFA